MHNAAPELHSFVARQFLVPDQRLPRAALCSPLTTFCIHASFTPAG
jgi:hypothetical protein